VTVAASIDIGTQIRAVQREIALRRQVYPKLLAAGRMTQHNADHEIAAMEAVLSTLTQVRDSQQGSLKL
jgi:hypothetical protein